MGNKESKACAPSGPRFYIHTKTYSRGVADNGDKFTQEVIPVPEIEYYLRGSLQSLCLQTISTKLCEYMMAEEPRGEDTFWTQRLGRLTPELKQKLWNHLCTWHFTVAHPPIPRKEPEIIWHVDGHKYLKDADQQTWMDVPRMILNQLDGVGEVTAAQGTNILLIQSKRKQHPILRPEVLEKIHTLSSKYDIAHKHDRPILEETITTLTKSSNLTSLDLSGTYTDACWQSGLLQFAFRTIADNCKALKHLNVLGFTPLAEDMMYFADNCSSPFETLKFGNSEDAADEAMIKIAKKTKNTLKNLDISGLRFGDLETAPKMFKFLANLKYLSLGGHEYTHDVHENDGARTDWGEVDVDKIKQLERERRRNGSSAFFGAITEHCLTSLVTLIWKPQDLFWSNCAGSLEQFLANGTQLEHLDLTGLSGAGGDMVIEMAAKLPHLTHFVVGSRWRGIKLASLRPFCEKGNFRSLVNLDLSSLSLFVTDEIVKNMTKRLVSRLQEINLTYDPNLTDEGLLPFLKNANNLKVLKLDMCEGFTDDIIISIAKNCKQLRELVVGSPNITSAAIEQLSSLTDLEQVDVSRCKLVTAEVLYKLVLNNWLNLKKLVIPNRMRMGNQPWDPYMFALLRMQHISVVKSALY